MQCVFGISNNKIRLITCQLRRVSLYFPVAKLYFYIVFPTRYPVADSSIAKTENKNLCFHKKAVDKMEV